MAQGLIESINPFIVMSENVILSDIGVQVDDKERLIRVICFNTHSAFRIPACVVRIRIEFGVDDSLTVGREDRGKFRGISVQAQLCRCATTRCDNFRDAEISAALVADEKILLCDLCTAYLSPVEFRHVQHGSWRSAASAQNFALFALYFCFHVSRGNTTNRNNSENQCGKGCAVVSNKPDHVSIMERRYR